jgi:hypothetical protein
LRISRELYLANIKAILYKFWNFWNRNPEAFEKELTIKLFFPEPEIYFHTKQKSDYLIFLIDWLIYWLVLNANPSNISAISWREQILFFIFLPQILPNSCWKLQGLTFFMHLSGQDIFYCCLTTENLKKMSSPPPNFKWSFPNN